MFGDATKDTNIYMGGSKQPFVVRENIDEVVKIIEEANDAISN